MHVIVISHGTTLGGTGAPGFTGDVAIGDEHVAPASGKAGRTRLVPSGR